MLMNEKIKFGGYAGAAPAPARKEIEAPNREQAHLNDQTSAWLGRVADVQVKFPAAITRPTAVLVDKSAGAGPSIQAGCAIAAMISRLTSSRFYAYAFDTAAVRLRVRRNEEADWMYAFSGLKARGGCSIGAALERLRVRRETVEQIVIVTAGAENSAPFIGAAYNAYRRYLGVSPNVVLVTPESASPALESNLRQNAIDVTVLEYTDVEMMLPHLIPLVNRPSRVELLLDVLDRI